jgi:hypothetical protein
MDDNEGKKEATGVATTRRGVERMQVDEEYIKASGSGTFSKVRSMAKEGWNKVRRFLDGKKLFLEKETGKILVKDGNAEEGGQECTEVTEEWLNSGVDSSGNIEVTMETTGETDTVSIGSRGSQTTTVGYAFLDSMVEDIEEESAPKVKEGSKRKRDLERRKPKKGLLGVQGWEWRETEVKSEDRWKRETTVPGTGTDDGDRGKEKIPLPEHYRLGLDERGRFLNHSGRYKNNFGANKEALFPGDKDKKREVRNWIATFTKSGCIACRDDAGNVNHKGKDGTPLVLVIGDEATPTVVSYTPPGSEENSCAWVLKKEHLALDEVANMLRRINDEKKLADKTRGKREHEFFIPNGSKILVSSYVHLRREGLEGYVNDFNNMVRGVQEVTGDTGVEVLPVVPVVFEGLDSVGRELLGGLRGWIEWIAEKTGRAEIKELA